MPAVSMSHLVVDLMAAESVEILGQIFREGMSRLVPADFHDIVVFGTGSSDTDLFIGTPGGFTPEERSGMLEFLAQNPEDHPAAKRHGHATGTGPVQVAELVGMRNWRRTEFYNRYNRRWKHDHELDCTLPGTFLGGIAALSIARSSTAFNKLEVDSLGLASRAVGLAVGRLLHQRIAREWIAGMPAEPEHVSGLFPELTSREVEVLGWLAEGKSDAEIACVLGIRRMTTSTHVRNIISKLRVENRVSAAVTVARRLAGLALEAPRAGNARARPTAPGRAQVGTVSKAARAPRHRIN